MATTNQKKVRLFFKQIYYWGCSPLGRKLKRKILLPHGHNILLLHGVYHEDRDVSTLFVIKPSVSTSNDLVFKVFIVY